jgi:hypothetical protein
MPFAGAKPLPEGIRDKLSPERATIGYSRRARRLAAGVRG